jgi:hypothetical protein
MRRLRGMVAGVVAPAIAVCFSAGCRDDRNDRLADAEVYVRSHCEDICARRDECAPVPEYFETCDVEECVAFRLDPPIDPCLGPRVELARCYAERESCADYFDMTIPTGPGTVCEELVNLAVECLEEHADEIAANATQGE